MLGRILLAALVAYALTALAVSAAFLWTPVGTFGFVADYGARITGVFPDSPAALAGIAPGDRVDLPATPYGSRPFLVGVTAPVPPGTHVSFRLLQRGAARDVTLVAAPKAPTPESRVALVFALVGSAMFIAVGTWLIVLRQNLTTWGFGLYCLLANPVTPALARFPSATAHLVYVAVYDVVQNVGVIGLLVFALTFPHTLRRRWRVAVARALPVLFVVLAAWTLWIDVAICVLGTPVNGPNRLLQLAFGACDVAAIAIITETYLAGPLQDRARLRWVLIGFYVGLVCNFVGNVMLYTANVTLPLWLDTVLVAFVVTLPLTVAYAIIRHRVIDTDFFISRAIVYTILTSLLVTVFALIDWLFSRLLADFRLSLVVDALATIGAAISFGAVHKRLERGVDEVLFRGRRLARQRLERLARALRQATAPAAIDAALVEESREALELVSVALFRRNGDAFRRVAASGWPADTLARLDDNDRLVLEHRAAGEPVNLADLPWHQAGLPPGVASPTVSVALRSRGGIDGVLLCSGTSHGEQLDPEELQWLEVAADAAATTYDELEAERLRLRAEAAEGRADILEARLDEARRAAVRNSPAP